MPYIVNMQLFLVILNGVLINDCPKSNKQQSKANNSPPIASSDHHKSHRCWDISELVYSLPAKELARDIISKFSKC